jgi:hypothetical protein
VEGRSGDGLENPAATEEAIITRRRRRERSHGRDYTVPTSALGQKHGQRKILKQGAADRAEYREVAGAASSVGVKGNSDARSHSKLLELVCRSS